MDELWFLYTMKYYSSIKINKLQIYNMDESHQ